MRKFLILLGSLLLIATVVYLSREAILQSVADFLIEEDSLQKADAIFVLSGGGYDRGNEAVKIYNNGFAPKIICTGGNRLVELKTLGIDTTEGDMTAANLRKQMIPDSAIVVLREGTSTVQEASLIIKYCNANGYKKVIVLSSKMHTHRVAMVFRKKFRDANIQLIIRGAKNSRFDETNWWKSESGLISVNSEWMKTIYYCFKY